MGRDYSCIYCSFIKDMPIEERWLTVSIKHSDSNGLTREYRKVEKAIACCL
jgi:hypothetical protein